METESLGAIQNALDEIACIGSLSVNLVFATIQCRTDTRIDAIARRFLGCNAGSLDHRYTDIYSGWNWHDRSGFDR